MHVSGSLRHRLKRSGRLDHIKSKSRTSRENMNFEDCQSISESGGVEGFRSTVCLRFE